MLLFKITVKNSYNSIIYENTISYTPENYEKIIKYNIIEIARKEILDIGDTISIEEI